MSHAPAPRPRPLPPVPGYLLPPERNQSSLYHHIDNWMVEGVSQKRNQYSEPVLPPVKDREMLQADQNGDDRVPILKPPKSIQAAVKAQMVR